MSMDGIPSNPAGVIAANYHRRLLMNAMGSERNALNAGDADMAIKEAQIAYTQLKSAALEPAWSKEAADAITHPTNQGLYSVETAVKALLVPGSLLQNDAAIIPTDAANGLPRPGAGAGNPAQPPNGQPQAYGAGQPPGAAQPALPPGYGQGPTGLVGQPAGAPQAPQPLNAQFAPPPGQPLPPAPPPGTVPLGAQFAAPGQAQAAQTPLPGQLQPTLRSNNGLYSNAQ